MIGYVLILRRRVCPLSRREATDRRDFEERPTEPKEERRLRRTE